MRYKNKKLISKNQQESTENTACVKEKTRVLNPLRKFATVVATLAVTAVAMTSLSACGVKTDDKFQDKVDSVMESLQAQNYTCNLVEDDISKVYYVNGSKVKYDFENNSVYYSKEGDKTTVYSLEDDNLYHKSEAEFDIDDIILNDFADANWISRDTKTDIVSGKMNGKDVSLKVEANGETVITGDSYKVEITDIGSTAVNLPSKDKVYEEPTVVEPTIPVEHINSIVEGISSNNFTYYTRAGITFTNYEIDANKIKLVDAKGNTKYLLIEEDKTYQFTYDATDSKWHKTIAEDVVDINELITNPLKNASWTDYKTETKVFTGEMEGKKVLLQIRENEIVLNRSTQIDYIRNIGSTHIQMPSENEIVDDTIEKPPVVVDALYTVAEDGSLVYDMAAVSDVLTRYIKSENGYSENLISIKYANDKFYFDKLLYTNILADKVEIGLIYNHLDSMLYTTFEINDPTVLQNLNNGTFKTKSELLTSLKEMSVAKFNNSELNRPIEYSTTDENFETTNKEQFDKLTSQVFKKLKDTGVQVRYGSSDGQKEDLTGVEVVAGFKGQPSKTLSPGYDFGRYFSWNQYYIVKIGTECQLWDFTVHSSATFTSDDLGNIMKGDTNWMIGNLDKKDLDKGTGAIYQKEEEMVSLATASSERTYTYVTAEGDYKQVNESEWFA